MVRPRNDLKILQTDNVSPRQWMRVFGFSHADVLYLAGLVGVEDQATLRYALAILKSALSWDCVKFFCGTDVRRRVLAFLRGYDWTCDATVRFSCPEHELNKHIRGYVDVFPVTTPQDAAHENYSGKYKSGVLKFELWVTNDGVPFAVYGPYQGRRHDSVLLACEEKFAHLPSEMFLADKAYVGKPHLMVPRKACKAKPITDDDKLFERHHRLWRSRVEHANSRINRFRIIRWCTMKKETVGDAVKFIVRCFHKTESRQRAYNSHKRMLAMTAQLCECGWKHPPKVKKPRAKRAPKAPPKKQAPKRRARVVEPASEETSSEESSDVSSAEWTDEEDDETDE